MSVQLNEIAGSWQFVEAYQVEQEGQLVITDSLEEAMEMCGPISPRDRRTYFVKGYALKNLHSDTNPETTPLRFFLTKEAAEQQWRLLLDDVEAETENHFQLTNEQEKGNWE